MKMYPYLSPMHARCGWPNCMTAAPSLPSIPISISTASTSAFLSPCSCQLTLPDQFHFDPGASTPSFDTLVAAGWMLLNVHNGGFAVAQFNRFMWS